MHRRLFLSNFFSCAAVRPNLYLSCSSAGLFPGRVSRAQLHEEPGNSTGSHHIARPQRAPKLPIVEGIIMSRKAQLVVLLLVVAAFAGVVFVASASEPPASADAAKIERGRYLLSIMGCGDCHTPKKMTEMGPVEDSTMLSPRTRSDRRRPGWGQVAGLPPVTVTSQPGPVHGASVSRQTSLRIQRRE